MTTLLRAYSEDGAAAQLNAQELIDQKKNCFIGWKCSAGVNSLQIDAEGIIYSANCRSFGQYGGRGFYGNIFDKPWFDNQWINCARRTCSDERDLAIPKVRKQKYTDLLHSTATPLDGLSITPVALAGLYQTDKQIVWDVSQWPSRSLNDLKAAVNRLEGFSKGARVYFILQGDASSFKFLPEFLRFLIEEKGHWARVQLTAEQATFELADIIPCADVELRLGARHAQSEIFEQMLQQLAAHAYRLQQQRLAVGKLELRISEAELSQAHGLELKAKWGKIPHYGLLVNQATSLLSANVLAQPAPASAPQHAPRVASVPKKIRVLCFIPMRNCEKTIGNVLVKFQGEILDYIEEVLVLDNNSEDNSITVARKVMSIMPQVKSYLLRNDRNYGFGGSHKIAFKYAYQNNYDYVLVVHGDNSADVNQFLPVLKDWRFAQCDLILSNRLAFSKKRENYPLYRLWANRLLSCLASVCTCKKIYDFSSGPINLYRVSTFINRLETPIHAFSDLISFPQDLLLYALYHRAQFQYHPIDYQEAGGKTFYSATTQFIKSLLLLTRYTFGARHLFKPREGRIGGIKHSYQQIEVRKA